MGSESDKHDFDKEWDEPLPEPSYSINEEFKFDKEVYRASVFLTFFIGLAIGTFSTGCILKSEDEELESYEQIFNDSCGVQAEDVSYGSEQENFFGKDVDIYISDVDGTSVGKYLRSPDVAEGSGENLYLLELDEKSVSEYLERE